MKLHELGTSTKYKPALPSPDVQGKKHTLRAGEGLSELLQHEIDHLNGILAIDRAIDSHHIIFKTEYEKWVRRSKLSAVSL
jgi:peptide deformylase